MRLLTEDVVAMLEVVVILCQRLSDSRRKEGMLRKLAKALRPLVDFVPEVGRPALLSSSPESYGG